MKCIKCGIELPENANFCDMCGVPQKQNAGNAPATAVADSNIKCSKCGIELPENANFCDMCGAPQKQNAAAPAASNMQAVSNPVPPAVEMQVGTKNRRTYILLCLFLGGLGIHNFYAGRKGVAIAQLLLSWTGISSIWALIELFAVKKDGQGCPMNSCSKQTMLIAVGGAVAVIIVFLLSLNHIVYGIGCCFLNSNYGKANAIFVRAAGLGNTNAMYEVGLYHEVYRQMDEAMEWYKLAAENDHIEAQLKLGRFYLNGYGTPEQAFAMFSMALENDEDNVSAQYWVAHCKLWGIGTAKDAEMAFELFKNIDESGEDSVGRDQAQAYLAHCYLNGDGVAKDVAKAIVHIRRGIEKNDPLASYLMADCLFRGIGVAQNYVEAAKFAKNAAEKGMVKAQILLNECFKKGNFSWNSTKELQDYAAKLNMTVDDKRVLVKGYSNVVPYGVVAIGERAIYSSMRNVVISDTVEYIAKNAFDCNELQEVVIPASVKKMEGAVFMSCSNLKKVVVLSEQIDFDVNSIRHSSFGNIEAENLKEILISPRAGFDGNTLNLVKLLPLTERQKQGYDLCRVNSQGELLPVNRLNKTVIVPDGVVNLACGFQHDDYLCKICREKSCDKSSCYLWHRNPSLKRCQHKYSTSKKYFGSIETVVLPESVEDLGGGFANFTSLKKVNIPGKVKEIPSYAFVNSGIESITLPGSIKKIGKAAFQNCDNLREITIPEGVTVIPENAFIACDRLAKVVIPDSVKKIERGAFNGCPLLKTIEVSATTTVDEKTVYVYGGGVDDKYIPCYKVIRRMNADTAQGIGVCSLSDDGKTLISIPFKDITKCVIPDGVSVIGENAFKDCKNLQEVSFPKSVRIIGRYAFANCIRLQSISLSEGTRIIDKFAFSGCGNLRNVNIPDSITTINEYAFSGCVRLKSIELPLGVRIVGPLKSWEDGRLELNGRLSAAQKNGYNLCKIDDYNVVYDVLYKNLEKCIIPPKVTKIRQNAFKDCTSLKYVKIPDSVTEIGRNAFRNCTSLESIEIPANVLNIEFGTFANCRQLKQVVIPKGIIGIDNKAFEDCFNLKEVRVPASVNIEKDAFPFTCKVIRY